MTTYRVTSRDPAKPLIIVEAAYYDIGDKWLRFRDEGDAEVALIAADTVLIVASTPSEAAANPQAHIGDATPLRDLVISVAPGHTGVTSRDCPACQADLGHTGGDQ